MKVENEEGNVKTFRILLLKHINTQEAGDLEIKLFNKNDESPWMTPQIDRSKVMQIQKPPVDKLLSNEER